MVNLSCSLSLDEYELIVNALNTLHWRARSSTLNSMCLAHRSFVPLCQKQIFSTVIYSPTKVDTFLEILEVSPHLADYIRKFYFEIDGQSGSLSSPNNADTVQFLDKLHNLFLLSISGPKTFRAPRFDWKAFDPSIGNALLRLILSPNLGSLELHRIRNLPLHGLLGLKSSIHLRTLSVADLEIDLHITQAAEASILVSTLTQLSKFSAHMGSASAVEVLVGGAKSPCHNSPVFDVTRLRDFHAEWSGDREAKASQMLIESASHLEYLFCVLPKRSSITYKGLAESILKGSLQTLRELNLYTTEPRDNMSDPFYGSITELAQLSGKLKCFESLDMDFNHHTTDARNVPTTLCNAIETKCKALDGLFADHDAFPSLRSVSIYFLISIVVDLPFDTRVLEQQFDAVARRIKQRSFQNMKAISTIRFNFTLDMEWR